MTAQLIVLGVSWTPLTYSKVFLCLALGFLIDCLWYLWGALC